ncbi:MAG: P1 family peptidase [Ignavibacteriales bacterium]|nr:P1 family peptidase [Ignavibacteriales bacterium]
MITDVPGIKIGHYTDATNITGCTVILCPLNTMASCDVRGSSPGSRELALLAPDKQMQEIHAILLSGGSAFGLGAANGVMKYLVENGIGYKTPWAIVPIVPGAIIFDLNIGSSSIFPTQENAYQACTAASKKFEQGSVGAGTGAVVGKWSGFPNAMKGGVGSASVSVGDVIVGAIAVVNAVGDIVNNDGSILAGAMEEGKFLGETNRLHHFNNENLLTRNTNTTLVVVATNARFSKVDTHRIAQRAHDGMSRAIIPCHTTFDGDVTFALSCGDKKAPIDLVAEMGAEATGEAIRNAVKFAKGRGGVHGISK